MVTKKGRLLNKGGGLLWKAGNEAFGETMDRDGSGLGQLSVVYVFPAEDSPSKFFSKKYSEFGKPGHAEIEAYLKTLGGPDDLPGHLILENEKQATESLEKVVQKVTESKFTLSDFIENFASQVLDVDKIAGILQISPQIFEIEADFQATLGQFTHLIRLWEHISGKRRTYLGLCQSQIAGNETIFVSLVNGYKWGNQRMQEKKDHRKRALRAGEGQRDFHCR